MAGFGDFGQPSGMFDAPSGAVPPIAGSRAPKSFLSQALQREKKSSRLLREPYPSELDYFQKNPHVGGMAAEDNRVIINPYSSLGDAEKNSVIQNETARIFMRTTPDMQPQFSITDKQRDSFAGYGAPEDIRATIAARILSGDPSAGDITPEQRAYVETLRRRMMGQ
jgi:hypothetical protein